MVLSVRSALEVVGLSPQPVCNIAKDLPMFGMVISAWHALPPPFPQPGIGASVFPVWPADRTDLAAHSFLTVSSADSSVGPS
jgi:hypothetical protein